MRTFLSLALLLLAATQAFATGPGVQLKPDNLDKQPGVRFIIQVTEQEGEARVTVIVVDPAKHERPVVSPWVNISDGKTPVFSCRLGTEKPASYDFGTLAYFYVASKLLPGTKVQVDHVVAGASSAAGLYWFSPSDFLPKASP